MTTSYDSDCILCNAHANFEFRDNGNLKLFYCNICGKYVISLRAEREITDDPNRKSHFAEIAASLKGKQNVLELTHVIGEGLHPAMVPLTKYNG